MEYLLTSNEMKSLDNKTIEEIGIPSAVLMEKAALGVIETIQNNCNDMKRILVVCGSGNNGGDGIAVGRILHLQGKKVRIVFVGDENKASIETKRQLHIARKYNIKIYNTFDKSEYNVIIDSVFGIGLTREIEGNYKKAIDYINHLEGYKVALDIPSGISADTGEVMGVAVKADLTVAIAYKKIGHVLYPGAQYSQKVITCDIGIYGADKIAKTFAYNDSDLSKIPERFAYSNKGTYGKVLIVAGSKNMAGAAYLAATAAYRVGCGLVRVFTPTENREILQSLIPEAILTTYDAKELDFDLIQEVVSWADVINIGPGMGKSDTAKEILAYILEKRKCPLVIDADGINLLAMHKELLKYNMKEVIITPHLKEMAGITNQSTSQVKRNLIHTAVDMANKYKWISVLKDTRTIVADFDKKVYINQSGNNGMAKAGSGDILSGIITGLLAQKMTPFEGAVLGTYIHGRAGDKAAESFGEYSMVATDIADFISSVMKEKNRFEKSAF